MSIAGRMAFGCFFLNLYVGILIGGTKSAPKNSTESTIVVVLGALILIALGAILVRDLNTSD